MNPIPKVLAASLALAFGAHAYALPTGGAVSAGSATIASEPGKLTINQSSQNAAINWQSFSIGRTEAVRFVQPNAASVALNRVLGSDASSILGSLSANGKVFLVNPNGILFGPGAQVNVGALVASTRGLSDSDFMAGKYNFAGTSSGAIVNQGSISADGGYVALLGANISNEGVISARLGTVALAAGNAMTLDVAGDGLLSVMVSQGAVNALAQNGGLIRADGGQVLLTARSAGGLLQSAVNNTGVIQAQTIENRNGSIWLMGDMQAGSVNVGGTLDASAPNGGNGGFIETSAAYVKIQDDVRIFTAAAHGRAGSWLIDPLDFTVGSAPGDNITGAALSAQLQDNDIAISTVAGPGAGNGDIFVTEAITWNGALGVSAVPTTLTLTALRNVNIGSNSLGLVIPAAAVTPTNGNVILNAGLDVNINAAISPTVGNLVVCCGQDINVNAAITTVNGSVLLTAGRDISVIRTAVNTTAGVTTTDGNIEFCAGRDVILNNANDGAALMTLTRGSTTAGQDLRDFGVPLGLTLRAGQAATGPGPASGTVNFVNGGIAPAGSYVTVTAGGPGTPISIYYNPINYSTPTPYSLSFTGTGSGQANITSYMMVYPEVVDKIANGSTAATLLGFKSTATSGTVPGTVSLVPGPLATANFNDAAAGVNKPVTYSDFSLAQGAVTPGDAALNFALPKGCCGRTTQTTGDILPALSGTVAREIPGLGREASDEIPVMPFLPVFFPALAGPQLSVVDGGIRMPPLQVVETPVTGAVGTVVEEVPEAIIPPPPRPARRGRN